MAKVFKDFDAVFFDPRDSRHEEYLRMRVEQLSPLERVVVLMLDEIHTAEKLTYQVCCTDFVAHQNKPAINMHKHVPLGRPPRGICMCACSHL